MTNCFPYRWLCAGLKFVFTPNLKWIFCLKLCFSSARSHFRKAKKSTLVKTKNRSRTRDADMQSDWNWNENWCCKIALVIIADSRCSIAKYMLYRTAQCGIDTSVDLRLWHWAAWSPIKRYSIAVSCGVRQMSFITVMWSWDERTQSTLYIFSELIKSALMRCKGVN